MAFYQVLECPCVCHSSLGNQTDYSRGKFPATCSFWLMPPPLRPGKMPPTATPRSAWSPGLSYSRLSTLPRASGVRRTPAARAPGDSELDGHGDASLSVLSIGCRQRVAKDLGFKTRYWLVQVRSRSAGGRSVARRRLFA